MLTTKPNEWWMGKVIDLGTWLGGFVLDLWYLLSCDLSNPQIHPSYPHQLPLTSHHSLASVCHVLGVKRFPPIAHQNGTPPSPAPRTKSQSIAWQTEMDWDIPDPVPSSEAPHPPKGCCHWQIIEVILGGVSRSSLPPLEGSYHKAMEGNSFLFGNKSHSMSDKRLYGGCFDAIKMIF